LLFIRAAAVIFTLFQDLSCFIKTERAQKKRNHCQKVRRAEKKRKEKEMKKKKKKKNMCEEQNQTSMYKVHETVHLLLVLLFESIGRFRLTLL